MAIGISPKKKSPVQQRRPCEEGTGMNMDRIIAVRSKKTVYRDGDRCLKVFNEDYSKADVLNEALNQARVEETGLSIPKVLEVTVASIW